jgi:D-alanyl-D-alanine carboxypeptidase/D-alanyl-D-alanine-endopeptidase (penicillin-binding protein 4)
VLVIVSVSSASVAAQAERPSPAPVASGVAAPLTPVLSARRVPEIVAAPVADRRLLAHLDDLFASAPANSCLTVAVSGRVVFSTNPAAPVVPASIEKLLTAEAAAAVLGDTTTFTTTAKAEGAPQSGVLDGNLWLVGGGDPVLMTDAYAQHFEHQPVTHTDLAGMADGIAAAGINHITGSVVGDESRYDTQRYLPEWPARFATLDEIGPMSSLTVNGGLTQFPPTPDVKTPKETPADDPAQLAADQLTQLLMARGVTVDGAATSGTAPQGATEVAHLDSPPLGDILGEMERESDNMTAELLTKELGLKDSGSGTTAAGVAAITKTLQAEGLPLDGTVQFDGSGLANQDSVTCALVQAVLDKEGPQSSLASHLAIAGRTGTLTKRFLDTPFAGRLRAKTGTLNQVTALAGYLESIQGAQLSFAFVMNVAEPQKITDDDQALEETLADILVQYPETPNVADLGPLHG